MAQEQKITHAPYSAIPKTLLSFIDGFSSSSKKESIAIFERVIKSLTNNVVTKKELETCYLLFKIINPKDEYEQIWCAQFIMSHVLGIHNLTLSSPRDKRIGIKFLKSANNAIDQLYSKRNESLSDT